VGSKGKVLAFEPNPQLLPLLRATASGLGNVELIEAALADKTGEATIYVPQDASMASLRDWTNGEPVVRFESYIDHSQSPMWGLLNPAHFPGVVAPCLHWSTSDSCV
jgi:FkbM family methyltransferase